MKSPTRFRLFMILQLCLGFSVLVWLLIASPILQRADKKAREHLIESIYQSVEKHPEHKILSERELKELPALLDEQIHQESHYPSNLLLATGLILANVISLGLLLRYIWMKWAGIISLGFLMSAFSYLPMQAPAHPLLDPRQTAIEESLSLAEAQQNWQQHLVHYYGSKIDPNTQETTKLELAKTLFEYDLLTSKRPIPVGFFLPASFWLATVIFLHGLWLTYILLKA